MKKENDEVIDLFRSRLSYTEMDTRDDSWAKLNSHMALIAQRKHMFFMRLVSSVAVLFVLLASSAMFWYLSPKEEMSEAFSQLAVSNQSNLVGDQVYQSFTPAPPMASTHNVKPLSSSSANLQNSFPEDSLMVSVSFGFSITSVNHNVYDNHESDVYWSSHDEYYSYPIDVSNSSFDNEIADTSVSKTHDWAVKTFGGIAFPNNLISKSLPFNIGVGIERKLNDFLAIETGVQYANVPSNNGKLHYLGLPIKLNVTYAKLKKVDLYASIGGIAEKCISGAIKNDFKHEPIQLAVNAAIGAKYNINDKLAVFMEPGVSHYFKTDSKSETTRTVRPTNFNVVCGMRMSF